MEELKCGSSSCRISSRGAFVSSLNIKGKELLKKPEDRYVTHSGMSVLIPYADIVKNGTYIWNDVKYELPKNGIYEKDYDNSIHGLVRSSPFSIAFKDTNSVLLKYTIYNKGYPSLLKIDIDYSLSADMLRTIYVVENAGKKNAPLQCGAHPYFIFKDFWIIHFDKSVKLLKDVLEVIPKTDNSTFNYLTKKRKGYYDDTFHGNTTIHIVSSDRQIEVRRTRMPYFEVYDGIYASGNSVAIEPLTGPPNSYNNSISLINLAPGEVFLCMFDISATIL